MTIQREGRKGTIKRGPQIYQIKTMQFWSNYSDLTRLGPPKGSGLEGKWDPLFQGNLGGEILT